MKRFFLFFFAALLSVSMFAAGETGKTKAQAIPYDWSSGIYVSSEAGVGKWYVVNLKKDMTPAGPFNANGKTDDGKTDINITIVNPLSQEVDINCIAYIGDNETSRQFKMAADGQKSMTFGAGMFVRMGINEVYLYLVTDVTVTEQEAQERHQAVNVDVQPVEANSVSFVPVDFVWGSEWGISTDVAVGNDIPANKETWVKIDRTGKLNHGWTFKLYVQNMGSTPTTIYGGLATDCPATNIQEQEKNVGTGSSAIMSKELDLAMLDMMPEVIYIRLKANQPLHVWAEQVEPTAPAQPLFNANDAIEIAKGTEYSTAATSGDRLDSIVYKAVYYPTLVATSIDHPGNEGKDSVYYVVIAEITNNGSTPVTLTGKVVKNASGPVNSAVTRNYTIEAGKTITKKLDKTLLSSLEADDEVYCLILGGNSNVKFLLKDTCLEENPCVPAQVTAFTWNVFNNQAAGTTKWYSVDIAAAKAAKADIVLTMNSTETANIDVDVAADCAIGEPTQSYSGSSTSTTKTLSYSLFKDNVANTIYVRVKTDKAIKVKAELLTAIIWNGYAWVGGTPDLENNAARIEGDLVIGNGETVRALGITLTKNDTDPANIIYHKITIKNGGKLIVGKEGFKGTENVGQIIIEEGGNLMIDPAATTNNKPFITAYKSLNLGTQTDPSATMSELHEFIALPVENRENSPVGLYYSNWTYTVGWGAVDGFRHAFVGYNVKESSAGSYCGYFAGQLAPNQNQTLQLPGEGWHAFGNSWLVPLGVVDMISHVGDADQAIYLYVQNPTTIGGVNYSTGYDENTKQYVPVTSAIISEVPALANVKPMEGFFLYTPNATTATLNYSSLYDAHKAPAKRAEDTRNKVAVILRGDNASDFVYMIEGEDANAHKMMGNGLSIYAEEGLTQVANTNLVGTMLTIQTGEATEYTLNFTWVRGETMYLKDLANGNIIAMTAENTYTFNAEPNSVSERFQVVGRQEVPTNIENSLFLEGANKRIENGKIVIIKNGVKYDVLGAQL